jgi:hypothetical protein
VGEEERATRRDAPTVISECDELLNDVCSTLYTLASPFHRGTRPCFSFVRFALWRGSFRTKP